MSHIDQNLLAGENIIHKAKLHWIVYIKPIIWAVIGLSVIFILYANEDKFLEYEEVNGDGLAVVFLVGLIIFIKAIVNLISRFIARMSTELVVTNKRLIIKTGFIRRDTKELHHSKVESLSVNQSFIGRMLNYGTVYVGTSGHGSYYPRIAGPLKFRREAMEVMDNT